MGTCGGDRRRLVLQEKKVLRNNKMQNYPKHNIPNDVVVEILLRLPAQSLVQFRWACKYWFDLITRDDDFIKMHLHHSTTHDEFFSIISPSVLSSTKFHCGNPLKFSQCYLNYNNATSYKIGRLVSIAPYEYPLDFDVILGSCNGLILLRQFAQTNLCIWNPCTKEYRILPPRSIEVDNYGFGYDKTTDDYKVIIDADSDVQVYTLGTNSWRMIGPNPYRIRPMEGAFVNGLLYWMDSLHENVISFDVGMEKFQFVSKLPNDGDHIEKWQNVKLQVFEGSLCVVLKIREGYMRAEMWVMKDYTMNNNNNNNDSFWTKLSTICIFDQKLLSTIPYPYLNDFLFPIRPLRYTRNGGEILMLTNNKDLVLYDPKINKDIILCRISKNPGYIVKEVYSESLVRLNSGTYTGKKRRIKSKKEQEDARH